MEKRFISFEYDILNFEPLSKPRTIIMDIGKVQISNEWKMRRRLSGGDKETIEGFYVSYDGNIYGSTTMNSYAWDSLTADDVGVYYVSRKFLGIGQALQSTTYTTTSSNPSYNTQLANAKVNNASAPYPCPFSARNEAQAAITAGTIKKAVVYVMDGEYTIGSDDPTKNGDFNGVTTTPVVADIQIPSAMANAYEGALLIDKITVYLNKGVTIHYINCKYSIAMVISYDSSPAAPYHEFRLKGNGRIIQYYSNVSGFASYFTAIRNPNVTIEIEADTIHAAVSGGYGLLFLAFKKATVNVRRFMGGQGIFLWVGNLYKSQDGSPQQLDLNIKHLTWGYSMTVYAPNQASGGTGNFIIMFRDWYGEGLGATKADRPLTANLNIDLLQTNAGEYQWNFCYANWIFNHTWNIKIKEYQHRNTTGWGGQWMFVFYLDQRSYTTENVINGYAQFAQDIRVYFDIDHMDTVQCLFQNGNSLHRGDRNIIRYRTKLTERTQVIGQWHLITTGNNGGPPTSQCPIYYEGTFTSYNPIVGMVHGGYDKNYKNYFTGRFECKDNYTVYTGWASWLGSDNIFKDAVIIAAKGFPSVTGIGTIAFDNCMSNAPLESSGVVVTQGVLDVYSQVVQLNWGKFLLKHEYRIPQ